MAPERWQQLISAFLDAATLPPDQRSARLERAVADPSSRGLLESMLQEPLYGTFRKFEASDSLFGTLLASTFSKTDWPSAELIGKTISHYQVTGRLGRGGMGEVYIALDEKLGRKVALKVLPPELASPRRRSRFEREAKAVAALNHPAIVQVYSTEDAEGLLFITMELVEGQKLTDWIPATGLPVDEFLRIAVQITDAVSAAHDAGIVHRDLKPDNIMVREDGQVKVLDFGLASVHATATLTLRPKSDEAGDVKDAHHEGSGLAGTIPYMAPEQALGGPVDGRADVFSLGVTFYQMLAGRRPFDGVNAAETLARILEAEPERLRSIRTNIQRDVERLIDQCLEKRAERRFGVHELARALTAAQRARSTRTLRFIAAGTFVLIGILAVALARNAARNAPQPNPRHEQLTFTGNAETPDITPDGGTIAFVAQDADRCQVVVRDLVDGRDTQVADAKGCYGGPRWSPDGRRLLVSIDAESGASTLLVSREGTNEGRFPFFDTLAWSPDGTRFAGAVDAAKIEIVDVASGASTTLDLDGEPEWIQDIDWSRRGVLALLGFDSESLQAIWAISTHSGERQKLVAHPREVASPRWSSDGTVLYYLRGRELWKVATSPDSGTATGAPTLVLTGIQAGSGSRAFDLSDDREKLVYARSTDRSNVWLAMVDSTDSGLNVTRRELTSGTFTNLHPTLSPDGRQVAFARYDGETASVYVASVETGEARRLASSGVMDAAPVWSPDGGRLAFASIGTEGAHISILDVDGAAALPLIETTLRVPVLLEWSPGPTILFAGEGDMLYALEALPQAEPTIVDGAFGGFGSLRVSPDGRNVAVLGSGLTIFSIEEATNTFTALTSGFGNIFQRVDGSKYSNREVRLTISAKTEPSQEQRGGQCWMRVDHEDGTTGLFDNMGDRPIRTTHWEDFELRGEVGADARHLSFGCWLLGTGSMWIDDFRMEVKRGTVWGAVQLDDGGFETNAGQGPSDVWIRTGVGYEFSVSSETRVEGRNALRIDAVDEERILGQFWPVGFSQDSQYVYAFESQSRDIFKVAVEGGEFVRWLEDPFGHEDVTPMWVRMSADASKFVTGVYEFESDLWLVENFDPEVHGR